MKARLQSIHALADVAHSHLRRNLTCYPGIAESILESRPVLANRPQLIALDAAEVETVRDFQWSPSYSGKDIYSATQLDPIVGGFQPADVLFDLICDSFGEGNAVVMPHALGRSTDPFVSHIQCEFKTFRERIYCYTRICENDCRANFFKLLESVCVANSVELGLVSSIPECECETWTEAMQLSMLNGVNCVFTKALDGDGYLIWIG